MSAKLYFLRKIVKSKKKKLALTSFDFLTQEISLGNSWKLICMDLSKMFLITSKYFSIFNNKPPASWVAHVSRDFLACYPCLYYSFMIYARLVSSHLFFFRSCSIFSLYSFYKRPRKSFSLARIHKLNTTEATNSRRSVEVLN